MTVVSERRIIVVACDSFKGSATAGQVCAAIADGWASIRPADRVCELPQADGGEGTADIVASRDPGACEHAVTVTGPDGRPVVARWWELSDSSALLDLAQASGLPLMSQFDAGGATSYGTGQVIADALAAGCRDVTVALGGSATVDGGAGLLRALGLRLFDDDGAEVTASGGLALSAVRRIDASALPTGLRLRAVSDVTSALVGDDGAARRFGPQKGADPATVAALEEALAHWARLWTAHGADRAMADLRGAGAAGGTGFGLAVGLGAELVPGAQWVGDKTGLAQAVASADVVITGEGRFDATSTLGKVPGHVLTLANGLRRCVVAGAITCDAQAQLSGVETVSLTELAGSEDAALAEPERWLSAAGARLAGAGQQ